jgi:hypothetical protein
VFHLVNQTVNALSITISPEEAKEIESKTAPVRESVRQMLEAYHSNRGNGEQQQGLDAAVSESVRQKFAAYRPIQSQRLGANGQFFRKENTRLNSNQ